MFRFLTLFAIVGCTFAVTISRELKGRVVNGIDTTIEEHPYQVSLQIEGSHRCGGSIISEDIILTAAHCIRNATPEKIMVRLGSTNHNDGGILSPVVAIKQHELYRHLVKMYDVGIIKLALPVQQSSTIRFINLAQETPSAGSKAVVTGWGYTSNVQHSLSEILQTTEVEVIDKKQCSSKKFHYGDKIKDTMFCAYGKGGDSCHGDSGGPVVANNLLVGIVSWGVGCVADVYPGVNCDVASVYSWITENMLTL